ncbi:DUF2007 domain-containing protein [Gallaecimonas kandeliae]|uniref:putative signal transducing protein n=1 Tax=Gallaecimonas kandeliae TaxID=3029055 RepID=UPI002649B644|nr:DUF2007 domain-containing protein [Gallaecimonas kandeliae]WKE67289.1 DUF2007 domain-containing protein [Gallaecimonas kandeliae]
MNDSLIYTAANNLEAYLLQGLFQGEGIGVWLDSDALMGAVGELPTEVQQVRIWCNAYQLDRAKQVLAGYLQTANSDWYCGGCGEVNGGAFEICWRCQRPSRF